MMIHKRVEQTAQALRRNNMDVYCVASKTEVPPLVQSLLHDGDTVAAGGSTTLQQTGVNDLLRSGNYRFLDRDVAGLTPQQTREIFLGAFTADAYLASANAVTLNGEIYNVDGNGNRVAALCYGPPSVILVVGCNKLVDDLKQAVARVKQVAAPKNVDRLQKQTYCSKTGVCMGVEGDFCTDGCRAEERICCTYVTMGYQRNAGRIKVILVEEPLGF